MITFKFIFSIKGITYISILAFVYWILQGYSRWRLTKQPESDNVISQSDTSTDSSPNANIDSQTDTNISLVHYILVSPFAATYVVIRGLLDIIRYSLYYLIWSIEKSIPFIDDWLFDFMTVTLPKRHEQLLLWWINIAQPKLVEATQYMNHTVVPNLIHYTELTIKNIYQIGCRTQSLIQDLIVIFRNFKDKHDWEKLLNDLTETVILPMCSGAIKCVRLIQLAYVGVKQSFISIKNDVYWIVNTVIPIVYNYVISAKLTKWAYSSCVYLVNQLGCWVYLQPLVHKLLNVCVLLIDKLVVLLENGSLHKKLEKIYKKLAPEFVWILFQLSQDMVSVGMAIRLFYKQIVYPSVKLFIHHIEPHLKIINEKVVGVVYKQYIYPAFWMLMDMVIKINRQWIEFTYSYVLVPIYSQIQQHISKLAVVVPYIQSFYNKVIVGCVSIVSNIGQHMYQQILANDWSSMMKEIRDLFGFITGQLNLIYQSFERTMVDWVKQQK